MNIASYKAVTKPLVLDFDGEVINLQFRPNVYTLGFQRRLLAALDGQDVGLLAETFAELISSWDLEDDEGIIPLTSEGIEKVPMQILAQVDSAIGEALKLPSEEEKKGSSEPSPSQPKDSSEPTTSSPQMSTNGSTTSESPTVSESVPTS